MKELVLHVGFHKTATSSFQATCAKNRERLQAQGLFYPVFSLDGKAINNHSIPICSYFMEDPSSFRHNVRQGVDGKVTEVNQRYGMQFEKALENHQRVLISGEEISMLSEDALGRLKEFVESRSFSIRVLCCVRRPYSFTCSQFQQRVQGGTLASFIGQSVPTKSEQVRLLKRTFERTEFYSFESECAHPGGPVYAMMERVGIRSDDLEMVRVNDGIGNIATRLYSRINAKYPVMKKRKLNPRGRNREVYRFKEEEFLLNRTEIESLREGLDKENAAMDALLGAAFTDKEYKPSGEFSIGKDRAIELIKHASRPAHTADVVAGFLAEHSDGSWTMSDLFEPLLEQSSIGAATVDYLRDQAILHEESNLHLAHQLMQLALSGRPNGCAIKRKLEDYRRRLQVAADDSNV